MEMFTYLFMGGSLERVTVIPLPVGEGERQVLSLRKIVRGFQVFDAGAADCFVAADKEKMLHVMRVGMGSVDAFNHAIKGWFTHIARETARKHLSDLGLSDHHLATPTPLLKRSRQRVGFRTEEERRARRQTWGVVERE